MTANWWVPLTPAEEATPAVEWPADALDRIIHAVHNLPDDEPTVPTPELDAIEQLRTAINAAHAALIAPFNALQLRSDDNLPATKDQRDAVRSAVWALRSEVARVLFQLAPEGGAES